MNPGIKNLVLKKAPLRQHILEKAKINQGRKNRLVSRIYTNDAGEKFLVKRNYSGTNLRGQNEKSFLVSIQTPTLDEFAQAKIEISKKAQVSVIDGREIYIFDVATHNFHEDPQSKKGRNIFRMVIDECQQLGIKEFGNKPYYITLIANNDKTQKHYSKFGFERIPGPLKKMRLKIN
ncbi:MAG: hypothetical protein WC915_01750 [archaeon]|jgi:hypothetical protein